MYTYIVRTAEVEEKDAYIAVSWNNNRMQTTCMQFMYTYLWKETKRERESERERERARERERKRAKERARERESERDISPGTFGDESYPWIMHWKNLSPLKSALDTRLVGIASSLMAISEVPHKQPARFGAPRSNGTSFSD